MVSDVLLLHTLKHVTALSTPGAAPAAEPLEVLRAPAFEAFLQRINLRLALYAGQQSFYFSSESICRMLGYDRATVYAKGPALLYQLITPEDRPKVDGLLQECERVLRGLRLHCPRISFDYHLVAGTGDLKRMYQHLLPNAVMYNNQPYTVFILHDFSGMKSSPALNHTISHLNERDQFVTLHTGKVHAPCPYRFTASERNLLSALARGAALGDIARQQHVSLATLKKHRNNLLKKSGQPNLIALLNECLKNEWNLNE